MTVNIPKFKTVGNQAEVVDPLELSHLCLHLPESPSCVWLYISLLLSKPPVTDFLLVSATRILTSPPLTSVSICLLLLLAQASGPHGVWQEILLPAHLLTQLSISSYYLDLSRILAHL